MGSVIKENTLFLQRVYWQNKHFVFVPDGETIVKRVVYNDSIGQIDNNCEYRCLQ